MQSTLGTITNVSDTAIWVAYYRAEETQRPDALFKDPFAQRLVGERGKKIADNMRSTLTYTAWSVIIRTVIIDRYIKNLAAAGVDMVINLGAGLDSRPYRMQLPSTLLWIEADFPHMIEHKEVMLKNEKPHCQLERHKVDLSDDLKRREFLDKVCPRAKNILVLTEGVVPYLTEAKVAKLSEDLRAQYGVRFWMTEYFSPKIYPTMQSKRRLEIMKNAPFQFFPVDWMGFFSQRGWKLLEIQYLAEESIKLGRAIPLKWWQKILVHFANKEKLKKNLIHVGYLLFTK